MRATTNTYSPDYAVHPGEILEERLNAQGMKKSEFAERCHISPKTVSQILGGKAPVSPENAIHFERVLGVPARLWTNLEANYRLFEARRADERRLRKEVEWAKKFPVNALVTLGYLPKPINDTERVEALLDFFGCGRVMAYRVRYEKQTAAYRKSPSFKSSPEALAAWLRIGDIEAKGRETEPFDPKVFRKNLRLVRRDLVTEAPEVFERALVEHCAKSGVALVFTPELPKTHACGATRWLRSDKALLMMTLRYKSDDHFWFTFFHEAGHILLHGKKDVYIEEDKMGTNRKEKEANDFASNFLIDPDEYAEFVDQKKFSHASVRAFARQQGLAPGVVVGRLQHDGYIPYSWLNALKRKVCLCR